MLDAIQTWFVKRYIRKQVIQGDHDRKVLKLYSLIAEAARTEFTEDNKPTLDLYLCTIHKQSLENV